MAIFSVLATPLGWVMKWIYALLQNYGWTIIVFTVLARVLMFPLSISQQKNSAKMQAYQPMIKEIQNKWANDKNRQNVEMQKFYEENNIKMTAGCLPMLVNMLVIFGMIYAIQAPLTHILSIPQQQVDNGIVIMQNSQDTLGEIDTSNTFTVQSVMIGEVKENPQVFLDGVTVTNEDGTTSEVKMDPNVVQQISDFNFEFMGFDLSKAPTLNFDRYLILPILSILTMLASQIIVMKLTPGQQQMGGQMMIMTLVMGVMFGFYAFRMPVAFSLYYTVSNLLQLAQQLVLRKMFDPAKIRAEVEAEIEARRAEKKSKKKVKVQDEKGEVVDLDVSEAELNKLRLAKARELDAKRYAEETADAAKAEEAAEKARKLDEEKYGKSKAAGDKKDEQAPETEGFESEEKPGINAAENGAENDGENETDNTEEIDGKSDEAAKKEYKPGRRKRATQKQKEEEASFADKERAAEQEKRSKETEES